MGMLIGFILGFVAGYMFNTYLPIVKDKVKSFFS